MSYTIGEAAKLTGISAHTLRYYDRKGLLPYLKKDEHGDRVFEDIDLQWLQAIKCMKVSGFSLSEMEEYTELHKRGDETLSERLAMFREKRAETLAEIERLRISLDALNYKCWYYEQAVEAGSERVHFDNDTLDLEQCYCRFKEWEEKELGHPSEISSLYKMQYPDEE